ncbi:MAG: AAA family ATPase [Desulfobacterales bacterium]
MIRRIELVNFMSHPHTVIEPASGLTVITGVNNTGKSAVISALQILCRNISGDYMVRHGQRECRIMLETGEGHVLEWKRKSGTVSYTVNGREVHRLRGSVPEDLHGLLRLPLVETETDPFDVHFGEQKKPIFLLDESPARRATFFASSSDAIKLIEMQNRHRAKVKEAKSEESRLVKEASRLQKRLFTLEPIEGIQKDVKEIEAQYALVVRTDSEIGALYRHVAAMNQAKAMAGRYEDTASAAQSLFPPPEEIPTEPLSAMICQVETQQWRIKAQSDFAKAAAGLCTPPETEDTRPLSYLVSRMEALYFTLEKTGAKDAMLDNCAQPPEMLDTGAIGRHIEALEKAQKAQDQCRARLKEAGDRLEEAERDLRVFIDSNKICPTCGQPMDADHVLESTADCADVKGK